MHNAICYRFFALSLATCLMPLSVAAASDINSSSSTSLDTNQMYFGTQESSGAISGSFTASSTAATNPPVMPPTHCEGAWHNGQSYTEWSACDFYGMSYRERTDRFKTEVFDMFGGNKCEVEDGTFRVVQENTTCPMNCVGAWDNPAWGEWSACSGGVKTSTRTLTYTVTQPERNGGAACPAAHGQTHIESQQTTTGCEPIPCAGSFDNPPWGEWSACVDGKKTRTRTLTYSINRYPENGGAACPHPHGFTKIETEQTADGCAPVNCQGSFDSPPWGEWSECVENKKTRTRTLTYTISQNAENGGAACPHSNGFTKTESEQSSDGCAPVCDYSNPVAITSLGEYVDMDNWITEWGYSSTRPVRGDMSPKTWGCGTITELITLEGEFEEPRIVIKIEDEKEYPTITAKVAGTSSPELLLKKQGASYTATHQEKGWKDIHQAIMGGKPILLTAGEDIAEPIKECKPSELWWYEDEYGHPNVGSNIGATNACVAKVPFGSPTNVGTALRFDAGDVEYCEVTDDFSGGDVYVTYGDIYTAEATFVCNANGQWEIQGNVGCECRD